MSPSTFDNRDQSGRMSEKIMRNQKQNRHCGESWSTIQGLDMDCERSRILQ